MAGTFLMGLRQLIEERHDFKMYFDEEIANALAESVNEYAGWFPYRCDEIENETGLTSKQQKKVIKYLKRIDRLQFIPENYSEEFGIIRIKEDQPMSQEEELKMKQEEERDLQ